MMVKNEKRKYTEKDHTFVICAYKESPFLEECILSVKQQELLGNIIMATATPNEYIKGLAHKYDIKLHINPDGGGIAKDWNYGVEAAKTKLVTLAHQDDIYMADYLKEILTSINASNNPLIAFTDYGEKRDSQIVKKSKLLKIKKILLSPLRIKCLQNNKWIRRRVLSIGSAICCPSVTLVKENLKLPVFKEGMKSNLDWEAWENISKEKGTFVYCNKILMLHRIHAESTTSQIIGIITDTLIVSIHIFFCIFYSLYLHL